MQLAVYLLLASSATSAVATSVASRNTQLAARALSTVFGRQTITCSGYGSCEEACGAGYINCVFDDSCYNPNEGQTCCSDGTYCPTGYYCSNAGCCDNSLSLEECGATEQLSTIAPDASVPTTLAAALPPVETSYDYGAAYTSDLAALTSGLDGFTFSEPAFTEPSFTEPTPAAGNPFTAQQTNVNTESTADSGSPAATPPPGSVSGGNPLSGGGGGGGASTASKFSGSFWLGLIGICGLLFI